MNKPNRPEDFAAIAKRRREENAEIIELPSGLRIRARRLEAREVDREVRSNGVGMDLLTRGNLWQRQKVADAVQVVALADRIVSLIAVEPRISSTPQSDEVSHDFLSQEDIGAILRYGLANFLTGSPEAADRSDQFVN